MDSLKKKIIYCFVLVLFLVLGIGFGYIQTILNSDLNIENTTMLDYAVSYVFPSKNNVAVSASTQVYDIEVVYEDFYTVCGETVNASKVVHGTTIDKVKEEEEILQEEKGVVYEIKGESLKKIIYTREIHSNCPNHFLVILEKDKINVYSILGEDKKELFTTLNNINIENLREELKIKLERGAHLNSKEELNYFIEDLES